MILNGYSTTVGSRFQIKDKIKETITLLQSTDRLTLVDNRGIYAVDHKSDFGLPPFIYPISTVNYKREPVTIFDQRTYFNKDGRNVNVPEYNLMLLAALLQQDQQKNNTTLMKTVRPYTIKAFANALGNAISGTVTLDLVQRLTLRIILAHYFVCQTESKEIDYVFVSQNAISRSLKVQPTQVLEIIEELGYLGSLKDLLDAIKGHPSLFALQRLDMAGLVAAGSTIFFSTSGFKMLMGAALELPTLFTAICFSAATQRIYQNTRVGQELDTKNDTSVTNFVKTVEFYLNGH